MISTEWQREALAIRRDRRDMPKAGWEYVGEGGGKLWELNRGCRIGYRIIDAKPSRDGVGIWIKTEDTYQRAKAKGRGRGMSVPKCTSWLGHKFEARYSTSRPHITAHELFWTAGYLNGEAILEASKTRVYQHDICVRCGHVVSRQPHNGEQGS